MLLFCSEILSTWSSTVFGHSKSTAASSGIFKGQEHTFVRSYSDRLLKCDLTLDMLSENEKVGVLMLTLLFTVLFLHTKYIAWCLHWSQKLHIHEILSIHLFVPVMQWSCCLFFFWIAWSCCHSDIKTWWLWILAFTGSLDI